MAMDTHFSKSLSHKSQGAVSAICQIYMSDNLCHQTECLPEAVCCLYAIELNKHILSPLSA